MDKKWLIILLAALGGVVFADKIRALPGGSHIPTF